MLSNECSECGSTDVHTEYLFPRENLDDLSCQCLECGYRWDLIIRKEKYEQGV